MSSRFNRVNAPMRSPLTHPLTHSLRSFEQEIESLEQHEIEERWAIRRGYPEEAPRSLQHPLEEKEGFLITAAPLGTNQIYPIEEATFAQ